VDKVKRADGTVVTVKQPLPLPQGVSDLAVSKGGPLALSAPAPYGAAKYRHAESALSLPDLPRETEEEKDQVAKPTTLGLRVKVVRVQGKPEGAVVQQVLESELSRLEKCFRKAREEGVKLPLQITLRIALSAEGKVTAARVIKQNELPVSLTNCLVKALEQVAFPKPATGQAEIEILLTLTGPAGS